MKLALFNSLTKKKESFYPYDQKKVGMYVCGPTVYDRPHIGNARSVVCYDVLFRLLRHLYGTEGVNYVRNITDIDDKIINRAREENCSIESLTTRVTQYFHDDMAYLQCLRPTYEPKATEHLDDIIFIIQKLLDQDFAYQAAGHVYFDVSKYEKYNSLSGQSLSNLLESVRIEQSDGKRNSADFVLWKPSDHEDRFATFDSPFGRGRPGWHIECSAMSHRFLGQDFDIHGGGVDLIFPHHTNEIAQSCCAFRGSGYAKYWVHNGFLTINGEKMSKSLGNFLTVKDLIDQKIPGEVVRLFLLSSHYRKPIDYTQKAIKDCQTMLDYWYRALQLLPNYQANQQVTEEFIASLADDLNTHQAIVFINDYAKKLHAATSIEEKQQYFDQLISCANFLGFLQSSTTDWFQQGVDVQLVEELIDKRNKAKKNKNWAEADKIREQLSEMGVTLEDKPGGHTEWFLMRTHSK